MNTRIVAVQLRALVRVMHNCSVRVPHDVTEDEMRVVLSELYGLIEGCEYEQTDPVFWKEDVHRWCSHSTAPTVGWEATRGRDGEMILNRPKMELTCEGKEKA